ncbi:MFS general substrate transporter [Aureobasidium subglaciale]|nr:MFS general substrate transporter [Aureobasidium subglaciale]
MAQRKLHADDTDTKGSDCIELCSTPVAYDTSQQEKALNPQELPESKAATSTIEPGQEDETDPEYPPTLQVVVIMACLMSAIFLMALDRTIIATAIPQITDEFDSINDIGWYGSAFMLTTTCFQLLWGKFYAFYPPKYIFLAVIALFEVGSAICGAAPNSTCFIIGRAIAGMGSAGILTGSFIIEARIIPLAKRPIYGTFFEFVLGLASVLGPLLGGAFTSNVSWRWCFYVNLPIGGAVMLAILVLLKSTPPDKPGLTLRQKLVMLDLLGELCLFPGLISLLLALQYGGIRYPWHNWRVVLLFIIFGLCLVAFVVSQIFNQKSATIKAHVIKNRSIVSAMWLIFCLAAVMQTFLYYLPLWLQAIKGKSAVQSGIDTLPFVGGFTLASIIGAQIIHRVGYYTQFAIASSCLMPVGAGLISTLQVNTSSGMWAGYQVVLGLGVGLGIQMAPLAAYTVLEPGDVPVGMALIFFCQQLSGAIFVSVGQNLFGTRFIQELEGSGILNADQILQTGATNIRNEVSDKDLPEVLFVYNRALRSVWILGIAMACISILGSCTLEWRSVKGYQGPTRKPGMTQVDDNRAQE